MYVMFISNNCESFHLRQKENLVKHQKVSKYYENDSRFIFEIIRDLDILERVVRTNNFRLYHLLAFLNPLPLMPFTSEKITGCTNEAAKDTNKASRNPSSSFYLFHVLLFQ